MGVKTLMEGNLRKFSYIINRLLFDLPAGGVSGGKGTTITWGMCLYGYNVLGSEHTTSSHPFGHDGQRMTVGECWMLLVEDCESASLRQQDPRHPKHLRIKATIGGNSPNLEICPRLGTALQAWMRTGSCTAT